MADRTEKRSELSVAPGLYVLRFLAGTDDRAAPSANVRIGREASGDVDIISPPGHLSGEMNGPGSNIVILARRPCKLEVHVIAAEGSSNLDARFTLDMLGAAREIQTSVRTNPRSVEAGVPGLTTSAHVARRGDVEVDAEGWVGGPRMPSAIEGLVFHSSRSDVGIAAQFCNSLEPGRWSSWIEPGLLIGTKQKASALTGLRLKLVGPDAARYELSVESLFLGSPIGSHRGVEVELSSNGGRDALVGLRLKLQQNTSASPEMTERRPSRVRVFR